MVRTIGCLIILFTFYLGGEAFEPPAPNCKTENVEDCYIGMTNITRTVALCESLCCTYCYDTALNMNFCRRETYEDVCSTSSSTLCPKRNLEDAPSCKSEGCDWCGSDSNLAHCRDSTRCTTCECENPQPCCATTQEACTLRGCLWCNETTANRNFNCMNIDTDGVTLSDITEFTECTRSCGSGTKWRYKTCDAESPFACEREYVSCNTQDCSSNGSICHDSVASARYGGFGTLCCTSHHQKCGMNSLNTIPTSPPVGRRKKRVIGGEDVTSLAKWPWLVSIWSSGTYQCIGTLISDQHVITSSNCTGELSEASLLVVFETVDRSSPGLVNRTVTQKHKKDGLEILELASPVTLSSTIFPICLPNKEAVKVDWRCVIVGSGLTTKTQDAMVTVSSWGLCEGTWAGSTGIHPTTHICAGNTDEGKTACTGDVGNPLMCQRCENCDWFLAGVGQNYFGCNGVANVSLYSNVVEYEEWILEHATATDTEDYESC